MGWLLKIILIFIGIYLIGKLIVRGLLSYLFDNTAQNLNERQNRQREEYIRQKKRTEGHITINYQPKSDKNIGKDVGDYVDYEEIK